MLPPLMNKHVFAVNLALLADPDLTTSEAISVGRRIHIRSGLSVDVKVAFNDIVRFEELLGCKIVVFYSVMGKGNKINLVRFQTVTPAQETTHYLHLHNDHYYGIKNVKRFLGVKFFCKHCQRVSVWIQTLLCKIMQCLFHRL